MENKKTNPLEGIMVLLPFLIVTTCVVVMWIGEWFWFGYLLFLIAMPAAIVSIVFMILFRKKEYRWHNTIMIWGFLNILLCIIYYGFNSLSQLPNSMARHYEKHKTEINELNNYFVNAIDDSCYVWMRFKEGKVVNCRVSPMGEETTLHSYNYPNTDSLLLLVGLDKEKTDVINGKLENIGCIGIGYDCKRDKIDLDWRYEGLGCLSYGIYLHSMTDAEKDMAMEYGIPYSDHVVFHNYGGAIGNLDFSHEQRDSFLKKHQPW